MINKDICDKRFIWNPSICECECDKLCDVGEYLDYKNCRFRKKLLINQLKYVRENNGTWGLLRKSIQFLYNIHSIVSHVFNNKHKHLVVYLFIFIVS